MNLASGEGWAVTRDFLAGKQRPLSGRWMYPKYITSVLARAGDRLTQRIGIACAVVSEEFAPVIRIEQNPAATMPAALTDDDAEQDADSALSVWMYRAGASSRRDY
ncbi:MAG: hypothetical protein R3F40_03565 [Candidatus Competibacteraceae bacterium]